MCNSGKFIDRSPTLRAAGVICPCNENIGDSLKVNPKFELAERWLKAKCAKKPPSERFPTSPCLPNDTMHETLTPELQKSRFAKFREQFFEDLYLRKPELGKARQVHSIPEEVNNESRTFGYKITRSQGLYELILPKKSVSEVNQEYIKWHSKYLISHKHYLPGEQVSRRFVVYTPKGDKCIFYETKFFFSYNEKFDRSAKFGKATNIDASGRQVKRCLAQQDRVVLVKGLQKYYLEKEFGDFGKKVSKFNDPHINDPKCIFGHPPNPNKCRSKDIVHNIDPCETNDELVEAIAYLHGQRYKIHNNPHFDIFELELALKKEDRQNNGYISLKTAMDVSRFLHLHLNEHKMRLALSFFKLLQDSGQPSERIHIDDFSKSLQSRYLLPNVQYKDIKSAVPHEMDTIYRQFCRDHGKPAPAGPVYRKKPEDDALNEIGPEAFDQLRDKAQLQRIFADIVCPSTFEQIWEAAKKKLKLDNDQISINDFRGVLKELRARQETAQKQ